MKVSDFLWMIKNIIIQYLIQEYYIIYYNILESIDVL